MKLFTEENTYNSMQDTQIHHKAQEIDNLL